MSSRELALAVATGLSMLVSGWLGTEVQTSEGQRLTAIQTMAQALADCERRHAREGQQGGG